MKKCLLWGMGNCFKNYIYMVKYHEMMKRFQVVGVTSNLDIYSEIRGYKYIKKSDLENLEFDFIIIMADGDMFKAILHEALMLGISKECILKYNVLFHENFDVDRCMNLIKNPVSIFVHQCWGGTTYASLGLEFSSPLINMWETVEDYLKLVQNPRKYMSEELELLEMRWHDGMKHYFPVVKCGDIILYFNHYTSFEDAKTCWEKRKKRINWDNLLVVMMTEDYNLAKEFAKLPYKKKVCFVPFETEEESLVYFPFKKDEMKKLGIMDSVIAMASGLLPYYDVFDLLEHGKVTKIVNME